MPDTVADLISACQRHLLGMHRGKYDRVGVAIANATDTNVTLEFGDTGVNAGAYLGVEDELLYVWAFDPVNKVANVQRGMLGSTAASHALGKVVEINPRYFTFQIRDEIRKEIRSWAPRLFSVATQTLTISSTSRTIATTSLSAEPLHILNVLRSPLSGDTTKVGVRFRWERSAGELYLQDFTDAANLYVTYARDFNTASVADSTELVNDILLTSDLADIVPYGVAWRLVSSREVGRAEMDAQAEPRDSTEVPPGHILQTARALKALRDERIAEASRVLHHKWGVRMP